MVSAAGGLFDRKVYAIKRLDSFLCADLRESHKNPVRYAFG